MENKIVLQPVVSEKSYNLANSENKYTFLVPVTVNKIETKKAVEAKYKVKVENINSTIRPGKMFTDWRTRRQFRKTDMKKMTVTLKKGDKIDEFLNI
jgi:large subunit ribosomal protein L23